MEIWRLSSVGRCRTRRTTVAKIRPIGLCHRDADVRRSSGSGENNGGFIARRRGKAVLIAHTGLSAAVALHLWPIGSKAAGLSSADRTRPPGRLVGLAHEIIASMRAPLPLPCASGASTAGGIEAGIDPRAPWWPPRWRAVPPCRDLRHRHRQDRSEENGETARQFSISHTAIPFATSVVRVK